MTSNRRTCVTYTLIVWLTHFILVTGFSGSGVGLSASIVSIRSLWSFHGSETKYWSRNDTYSFWAGDCTKKTLQLNFERHFAFVHLHHCTQMARKEITETTIDPRVPAGKGSALLFIYARKLKPPRKSSPLHKLNCLHSPCTTKNRRADLESHSPIRVRWFPQRTYRFCVSHSVLCTLWKSPHPYWDIG